MKNFKPYYLLKKYNINIFPHLLLGFSWSMANAIGDILQSRADYIDISSKYILFEAVCAFFYGILVSLVSCFLWLMFTRKLSWIRTEKQKERPFLYKQYVWFLWFFFCFFICLLAYYPAIYSYDAQVQLEQWITGNYSTHHPLIHTLLTGFTYQLGISVSGFLPFRVDGMLFYSLFQIIFMAYSISRAMKLLIQRKAADWVLIVAGLLFGILPVHPLLSVIITKDVLFSGLMLLQFVYLIELLDGKEKSFVKFLVVSVLVMLFRKNGVYAMIGLILFVLLFSIRSVHRKKLLFTVAFSVLAIVLFMGSSHIMNGLLKPVYGPTKEMLSVPMQQMARTYKSHSQDMSQEDLEKLLYYIPAKGCENYRQWLADPVKLYFSEEHFKEDPMGFGSIYLKMFRQYPSSFITAGLYQTMGYWYPSDISHTRIYEDWWRDRVGYLITDATPVFMDDYVVSQNPVPCIRDYFEKFATECVQLKIPGLRLLFEPSFYCWALLILIVLIAYYRRGNFAVALAPVAFYLLTCLAGPCVLVRYVYPLMLIIPFAIAHFFMDYVHGE